MKKVQFVCIGNCCRSQMAEGFATYYGEMVLHATSSGLSPTRIVAPETIATMARKNIDISHHFPKRFDSGTANKMDLLINMSGYSLPGRVAVPAEEWDIFDPYGDTMEVYWEVANTIEERVLKLIDALGRLANN